MSVNGKFNDITRKDLLEEADRFSVPGRSSALADVRSALESWPEAAKEARLGQAAIDRVAKDFRMV
jgi:serine/threonine-protein kinase HipA